MDSGQTLRICLLGSFRPTLDGEPVKGLDQARLQYLLAYLLLHRGVAISRQQLAFAFWPDTTDEQARGNLRTLLHRLRDALPEHHTYFENDRHNILWRSDAACSLDVADFEVRLARAAQAHQQGNRGGETQALEEAVALYSGDLLPDCYDDWAIVERERLHQAFLHALDQLVLLLEQAHVYAAAIRYAQLLMRQDRLNEAAYRHLMHLHLASGDRASALRVYHSCATYLRRELGVDPGPATQTVYDLVLHADESPSSRPAASSPPSAPGLPALVGRQSEWAQLQSAWRDAVAGNPQMVLLVGETGIGKTRLAEDLLDWVARQQHITAAAHCHPTERILAYAPVVALLRDPTLYQRLQNLDVTWLTEISRLLPELAATHPELVAPGPMTEPWQRQRLFQALAHAILTPAAPASVEPAPLLLLIDDVQWCDPDTLDWLLYLLDTENRAPLLVVATAFCREFENDDPIEVLRQNLARRGRITQIELTALPPAAAAELATGIAGHALSAEEAASLQREAEGNPLFIVEMTRAGFDFAAQEGRAQTPQAAHEPAGSDDERPLPPKVEAAIRRRLAELSVPARELAQTAAVIGRTFTVSILARIGTLSEDALLRGLDELWWHRIVREQGADAYDFTHDKLRVVAYAGLSPARRRQLHRKVAEALETQPAAGEARGGLAAQLAHHHLAAGDERKALGYLLRAGDQARVMYAHQEATAYYERASALQRRLGQPDAAARTLLKLGLTHHNALDFPRAREAYDAGFALWQHADLAGAHGQSAAPQTLRIRWSDPTTFDPGLVADFGTAAVIEELFTGLAEHGPDADIIPAAAQAWDVEAAGRRYIFHLRRNLHWSDGAPLVAADFAAGWRRVLEPATAASCAHFLYDVRGARAFHQGETDDPAAVGVYAADDLTLVVELEQPTGYFPHMLANPVTYPIPRHVLAQAGDAWAQPARLVSNGPYRLADWQPGQQATLIHNPCYSGSTSGNIHRVELDLHTVHMAILDAYAADALDVVYLDSHFTPAEIEAFRQRYAGELVSAPQLATCFLGFDDQQPPWQDGRVRRAFVQAIDRELLAGAVLKGLAIPATGGLVPPGMPGHVAGIGLPFDPAAARRLLAEAGYPDGRGFPTQQLVCQIHARNQVEFLADQWQRHLGLRIDVAVEDWPVFLRWLEQETLPLYCSTWRADYPDPDNFLRAALNWRTTRWHNTTFESLIARAGSASDPRQRLTLYAQAEQLLVEEAAIVPLNYRRSLLLIKPRITRYPFSSIRPWFWQDVTLAPP